jgi:hypothetical protein
MKQFGRVAAFAAVTSTMALTTAAQGQWTVTNLNPAGATVSYAYAAGGGQQVGETLVGGVTRASLWSGTAASWVDLNPAGAQ